MSWGQDDVAADEDLRAAVERWQVAVHAHGPYDLDLDTSELAPAHCADVIVTRLADGPPGVAFARLADRGSP